MTLTGGYSDGRNGASERQRQLSQMIYKQFCAFKELKTLHHRNMVAGMGTVLEKCAKENAWAII